MALCACLWRVILLVCVERPAHCGWCHSLAGTLDCTEKGPEQQCVVGICFLSDGCDQIFQARPCSTPPRDGLYPQTEVSSQPLM